MENQNTIYREKSLKRVASPEELDDYIRVTSPGVWLILTGIIVFLLGVLVWGYFGRLETTLNTYGNTDQGVFIAYVTGQDMLKIEPGMKIKTADIEGTIKNIHAYTVPADEIFPGSSKRKEYNIEIGTPLYPVVTDLTIPDGNYDAQIILEEIKPMDLVFN